ncbi:PREDICTED: probable E3 ubiquitin-protein ligase makorin-3, partial [Chinchilla lanigera]|uniref:probable E3 ubiquitin-protein ligase makorin-3 n=1 Tax=Chinchilla lanigera TaxID=34839 RepID=UPI000697422C
MEDPTAPSDAHGDDGAKAGAEGEGQSVSPPHSGLSASGQSEAAISTCLNMAAGPAPFPVAVSPVQPLSSRSRPAQPSGGGARPNPLQERSSGSWINQILCRYYLHEQCKEGENCCYSHDLAKRQIARERQGLPPHTSAEKEPSVVEQSEPPTQEEPKSPPAASSSSLPLIGSAAERGFFEAETDNAGLEAAGGGADAEGGVGAIEFVPQRRYQDCMALAQAPPVLPPPVLP